MMGACCSYYDNDMPSFINTEWRKARKQHKCCECGGKINPGETYEYICGKWDYFDTFKTCEKCADLRESMMNVSCPYLGGLREDYIEYLQAIGQHKYDEDKDEYIYPENHMKLNR